MLWDIKMRIISVTCLRKRRTVRRGNSVLKYKIMVPGKDFRMKTGSTLKKRLHMLMLVCLVPLTVMAVYLLTLVNQLSERYDFIVENITMANAYNINFKEDMDYLMYIIVANSERAKELVDTEQSHIMISEAREVFQNLYEISEMDYGKNQLNRILKSLNTLEDRVEEIERDALVSGYYDKNMERLDLNIRILTELIQEQMFLLILAGALFISRKITTGITEPIRRLCEATRVAGSGDFAVRAQEVTTDDELSVLNTSFNQMVEKIGNLVEDIRVEQLNLRAMELKLLQAQINPHFLYNTLDAIIWLAEAGEKAQVVRMVSSLSDFFRTTLSKGRDDISVEEEETHIRSYLEIQQFRYRDILEYEIRIPEKMHHCRILKLTLQPLVENALYHGIKNKRGLGHILVTGKMEGEKMIFSVSDDGIGMDPDRLKKVRRIIAGELADENPSSGFGLFNVEQRIKLNCGTEYGLVIDSVYGRGTTVQVMIPIVKK